MAISKSAFAANWILGSIGVMGGIVVASSYMNQDLPQNIARDSKRALDREIAQVFKAAAQNHTCVLPEQIPFDVHDPHNGAIGLTMQLEVQKAGAGTVMISGVDPIGFGPYTQVRLLPTYKGRPLTCKVV